MQIFFVIMYFRYIGHGDNAKSALLYSRVNKLGHTGTIDKNDITSLRTMSEKEIGSLLQQYQDTNKSLEREKIRRGDYLLVKIVAARGHTLKGQVISKTTIATSDALGI